MSVAADIVHSWVRPRRVVRRLLAAGVREDRNLVFLMLGCGLIFLAGLPQMVRLNALDPDTPFQARIGAGILAWLFFAPLAAYVLAGLSHLFARVIGGKGSFSGARLALFWAPLAAGPVWLVWGVLAGYLGQSAMVVQGFGLIALALFFYIWLAGLIEAERGVE